MSRLEEIKNEYAINQGFISWKELWFDTTDFKHANERIDEVMKIYAKECVEASLEIASEHANMTYHNGSTKNNSEMKYFQNGADNIKANKESITNKENIILL